MMCGSPAYKEPAPSKAKKARKKGAVPRRSKRSIFNKIIIVLMIAAIAALITFITLFVLDILPA